MTNAVGVFESSGVGVVQELRAALEGNSLQVV